MVGDADVLRFEPTADGRTRLHNRMSYNPPGGWHGHDIAVVTRSRAGLSPIG